MKEAGDIDGARAWNDAAARTATEDEWRLTMLGADLDLLSGNVAAAREKLAGLEVGSRRNGNPGGALYFASRSALATFWVENDPDAAAAALTASIDAIGADGRSARDQGLPDRALIFALAGNETAVASTLSTYRAGVAPETDPEGQALALAAERLIAVRPGDEASFLALDRALDDVRCARCADLLRGVGAEEAGDAEAAIVAYERYLAHPFFDAGNRYTSFFVANVHERLGALYEDVGDPEKAVEHYGRFAELWRNADAALTPRVDHARARVEVLASKE
jgi:tetratricopeptide (TPR) repeat protein